MKKRIALVAVLLLVVGLLVSCGNPESLAGTKWEYSAVGTGVGWKFTATEATNYAIVLGLAADGTTFDYTYDGTNVTIFDDIYGSTYTYATGVVDGNKLTMSDGLTYKKK